MPLQSFKDLVVWIKSEELCVSLYKEFASCRDYGFKDQVQRAGISIMNNIAEGYGRRSDQALSNFLSIARGSAAEVESMILVAYRLEYIDDGARDNLLTQLEEVSKLLTAFKNKVLATR